MWKYLLFMVMICIHIQYSLSFDEPIEYCDHTTPNTTSYDRYFKAMTSIYKITGEDGTCLPVHKQCGWPRTKQSGTTKLPLFVLSVGLEGAGHHLWTEIFQKPIFDCVWTNGRHYHRDVADGVPRTTLQAAYQGFKESFALRAETGLPPCKTIYDAEDSFPTGAIRKAGRVFMRPDLVHLQAMDGILFNIKYLLILRNTTDTAMSALRRNFFSDIPMELRTVEHTLTYVEAALRKVPCHKIFIAHYEHVLAEPRAYLEPLSQFMELSNEAKTILKQRLGKPGKLPSRKAHKLDQYEECKSEKLTGAGCYQKVHKIVDSFFIDRSFMWPTFAGDGFLVEDVLSKQ